MLYRHLLFAVTDAASGYIPCRRSTAQIPLPSILAPAWLCNAILQVVSDMVSALERRVQPKAKFAHHSSAAGQQLQSAAVQSARHHSRGCSVLPLVPPGQHAQQGMPQCPTYQWPVAASQMLHQQHLTQNYVSLTGNSGQLQAQPTVPQLQAQGQGGLLQMMRLQIGQVLMPAPAQQQQQQQQLAMQLPVVQVSSRQAALPDPGQVPQ